MDAGKALPIFTKKDHFCLFRWVPHGSLVFQGRVVWICLIFYQEENAFVSTVSVLTCLHLSVICEHVNGRKRLQGRIHQYVPELIIVIVIHYSRLCLRMPATKEINDKSTPPFYFMELVMWTFTSLSS